MACLAIALAVSAQPTPPSGAVVPMPEPPASAEVAGTHTLEPGLITIASAAAPEPAPPAPPAAVAGFQTEVLVVSSWFGPGLYGNRTACGQALTTTLAGVAHRTLPCGTIVTLRHGGSTVEVPVVDRGPFIYSREFDLTFATKVALGCPDLCRASWLR